MKNNFWLQANWKKQFKLKQIKMKDLATTSKQLRNVFLGSFSNWWFNLILWLVDIFEPLISWEWHILSINLKTNLSHENSINEVSSLPEEVKIIKNQTDETQFLLNNVVAEFERQDSEVRESLRLVFILLSQWPLILMSVGSQSTHFKRL